MECLSTTRYLPVTDSKIQFLFSKKLLFESKKQQNLFFGETMHLNCDHASISPHKLCSYKVSLRQGKVFSILSVHLGISSQLKLFRLDFLSYYKNRSGREMDSLMYQKARITFFRLFLEFYNHIFKPCRFVQREIFQYIPAVLLFLSLKKYNFIYLLIPFVSSLLRLNVLFFGNFLLFFSVLLLIFFIFMFTFFCVIFLRIIYKCYIQIVSMAQRNLTENQRGSSIFFEGFCTLSGQLTYLLREFGLEFLKLFINFDLQRVKFLEMYGFEKWLFLQFLNFIMKQFGLKTAQVAIVFFQDLLQSFIKLRPFGMIWLEGKHLLRALVKHLDEEPGMSKGFLEIFDELGDFSKILVEDFLKGILALGPLVFVEVDDCLKFRLHL